MGHYIESVCRGIVRGGGCRLRGEDALLDWGADLRVVALWYELAEFELFGPGEVPGRGECVHNFEGPRTKVVADGEVFEPLQTLD